MRASTGTPALVLPGEPSEPMPNIGDYTMLIYGAKKIGKTSLAAQMDDALFCMFEPGGKGLSIFQMPVPDWSTFKGIIGQLETTDRFKTVVIDTVDIAYVQCLGYVGRGRGFEHPSEMNDFGKSWNAVKTEFANTINQLVATGRGVIFISHAQVDSFQKETGGTYNRVIPTMGKQPASYVTGFVDIIGYYGYVGTERFLTIHGSDTVEAGHRIDGKFLVKVGERENGQPIWDRVHSIPMGNTAAEGYANFLRAFNNEQDRTYADTAEAVKAFLYGETKPTRGK